MRFLRGRASLLVVALLAGNVPSAAQMGFDRAGGDYAHFVVKSGDPALCAARCDRDPRCRAWSFSYPRMAGPDAICWLKSEVVRPAPDPCCASGVKGSGVLEPRGRAVEFSIDRVGGDYRNFDTAPDPYGSACARTCEAEGRCRAWTYLRPGYQGAPARCFLKERLTPPRRSPCCLSGVVR